MYLSGTDIITKRRRDSAISQHNTILISSEQTELPTILNTSALTELPCDDTVLQKAATILNTSAQTELPEEAVHTKVLESTEAVARSASHGTATASGDETVTLRIKARK